MKMKKNKNNYKYYKDMYGDIWRISEDYTECSILWKYKNHKRNWEEEYIDGTEEDFLEDKECFKLIEMTEKELFMDLL